MLFRSDPRGLVVVELAAPGTETRTGRATLRDGSRVGQTFPWSVVGVDDVHVLASEAGLHVSQVHRFAHRWCAVLTVSP